MVTIHPAPISPARTGHSTKQYIPDAVIACLDAIDPGLADNSQEIPNVPAVSHDRAQETSKVQPS